MEDVGEGRGGRSGPGASWAVVLAAGDGERLSQVTRDERGRIVPKQFCSLVGPESMLRSTLRRSSSLVPPERTIVVVAEKHRRWWQKDLSGFPRENVLIQPANKGTANGILLPLIFLALRDPEARVLVLPSDHHIEKETVVRSSLANALDAVCERPERVVLLGISPTEPDTGYGWIVPAESRAALVRPVSLFREKPDAATALRLMEDGALWNSFMLAGRADVLLSLYGEHLPELLRGFLLSFADDAGTWEPGALEGVYDALPLRDFSRDLLEKAAERLDVLRVPPCGWTDLGTPARLAQCLGRRIGTARGAGRELPVRQALAWSA